MRRTVTFADDVIALLKEEIGRSGESFGEAVNRYLRMGFAHSNCKRKPYTVKPKPLGLPSGMSYDCIAQLLEGLEGPWHH